MLNAIKNYLLRQEIKNSNKVQKQFVEWERVQLAVVLVGSGQYQAVKEFVKQSGKNFDVIVFHSDKISRTEDCFLSLNKKDFNFFSLPKPEISKKIKEKTYDILISADFNDLAEIRTLTGLISAKCKLGHQSPVNSEFFDISIQSNQKDFLKQAHKYLMMIKS
jgi:hypothetical protein